MLSYHCKQVQLYMKGDTMIKGYFVDRDGQIYYYENGEWKKVERRPV